MTDPVTEAAAVEALASAASRARNEIARLLSYIVIGGGSVYCAVRASVLPASRWEPLGAGSFPELVFSALAVLCAIAAIKSVVDIRRAGDAGGVWAAFRRWLWVRRVSFAFYGLLVVYLAVLKSVGFSVATFVFLLIAQLMIAGVSRRVVISALIAAAVFSFGLNMLFADVFNVFLPRGTLFGQ
jgi:hypothetical protein